MKYGMNYEKTTLVQVDKITGSGMVMIEWDFFDDDRKLDTVEKFEDSYNYFSDGHRMPVSQDLFEDNPTPSDVYRVDSDKIGLLEMDDDATFFKSSDEQEAYKEWADRNMP